jgi:hypothetical protein
VNELRLIPLSAWGCWAIRKDGTSGWLATHAWLSLWESLKPAAAAAAATMRAPCAPCLSLGLSAASSLPAFHLPSCLPVLESQGPYPPTEPPRSTPLATLLSFLPLLCFDVVVASPRRYTVCAAHRSAASLPSVLVRLLLLPAWLRSLFCLPKQHPSAIPRPRCLLPDVLRMMCQL